MDELSILRASEAHPKIRQLLIDTYTKANNVLGKGCRLRLSYVYRSPEEQEALYAQGRTKKELRSQMLRLGAVFTIFLSH